MLGKVYDISGIRRRSLQEKYPYFTPPGSTRSTRPRNSRDLLLLTWPSTLVLAGLWFAPRHAIIL